MSIDIKGKNVKLWKNEHETKDGRKFCTFSVSASRKMQDGTYRNKSVKLNTSKTIKIPNDVPSGTMVDFEGFLTLDVYTDRDGNEKSEVAIFVTDLKYQEFFPSADDDDSFEQMAEDIPF